VTPAAPHLALGNGLALPWHVAHRWFVRHGGKGSPHLCRSPAELKSDGMPRRVTAGRLVPRCSATASRSRHPARWPIVSLP
jgi:hypothetical protein